MSGDGLSYDDSYIATTSADAKSASRESGNSGDHLAAVPPEDRSWSIYSYFSMWVASIVTPSGCIAGASLLSLGSSFGEVAVIYVIASLILLPCFWLNAAPGAKYGISFPVYCRASFGYTGAIYAALSRGVVAIGWLSFQLWVGTQALFNGLSNVAPSLANSTSLGANLNVAELITFVLYIGAHMVLIWTLGPKNIERAVKVFSAVQIACVVGLLVWALVTAPLDVLLQVSYNFSSAAAADTEHLCGHNDSASAATSIAFRVSKGVTASISGWSTMALNIADLSRYALSQKSQVVGQSIGFVAPNIIMPMVGILVTAASVVVYGQNAQDWSIVELFNEWTPAVGLTAAILLSTSLLSCNLLANVVSPANDIANMCPSRISFRAGAMATLVLSGCTCPWIIFDSANSFVTDFLIGYSSITGAILGIMLADYFIIRGRRLSLRELYDTRAAGCQSCRGCDRRRKQASLSDDNGLDDSYGHDGGYGQQALLDAVADDDQGYDVGFERGPRTPVHHASACGVNLVAVVAIIIPLCVVGPGFVNQLRAPSNSSGDGSNSSAWSTAAPAENPASCPDAWDVLYGVSWFVTLGLSVVLYYAGSRIAVAVKRSRL